jgi:hypothetical protein
MKKNNLLLHLLIIFSLNSELMFGFEFEKLTLIIKKEVDKFLKTRGISNLEKEFLKNAKYFSFKGKLVAKRNSTFYPYVRDALGRTNIERMEQGLAPIGKDGLPVELHHLKQKDDGIIVELTASEHKNNYKTLHRYEKESQIDRNSFNKWKRDYWKARAKDFK